MTMQSLRNRRIVVVGGNIAGLRALEELRAKGHDGPLAMVSEETRLPYERPSLSKEFLTSSTVPLEYRDRAWFDANEIELHLGQRATGLDLSRRIVDIDGNMLPYDGLLIATGARPVNPWSTTSLKGVLTLRTVDDAITLRRFLIGKPRVVIVGAGFIGAEVASSACAMGCPVTIVEAAEAPFVRALGVEGGRILGHLAEDHGVKLCFNTPVTGYGGQGRVEYVETATGERVPADIVVVGIGIVPNVEWLSGSGLLFGNSLKCDDTLCAGPSEVYAAGDVVSFDHPRFGRMRSEHWTSAALQGRHAAANLIGQRDDAKAFDALPYFWSDQYGSRLQLLGVPNSGPLLDLGTCDGDPVRWVIGWAVDGHLAGVMALNWPERIGSLRGAVLRGDPIDTL